MKRLASFIYGLILFGSAVVQGQDKLLTVDDIVLRYQISGDGAPVVLIHGWGNSLESWHFLFPELSDDYTVIRYDRRGFGQSSGIPDLSLDPIDLKNLLDSLNIEKPVVIGHSQGAESALRYALAFPERLSGLVLFGCSAPEGFGLPWNGPDALPANLVQIARDEGLDAMRAKFSGHPIGKGAVAGSEGLEIMRSMFYSYKAKDLLNTTPSVNATPPPDIRRLTEVSVPTLVVTGELEMPYFKIVADALAYGIKDAKRVVVPGGGHSVHLQKPELFNVEIKTFLESLFN